jgi:hypothetical protein
VLLKCVHPLQWPYDELLLALALSQKSIEGNEKDLGVVRGGSKMQDCMAVLSQREELSFSVPLNPIKSTTAKALLAMHSDISDNEIKATESQQIFRTLVAKAVQSKGI